MNSTIGLFVVNSSVVSDQRRVIAMRTSFSFEVILSIIIPEYRHPLLTKACAIFLSFINALTIKESVFSFTSALDIIFG